MIRISTDLAKKFSNLIFKYAWLVIMVYLVAAVFGFFYTAQNLRINSNTSEMFDEKLPFRQIRDHYKEAFPLTEDNFVIVVSGPVPELVLTIADSISRDLKKQPELFESVYQPTGEKFFKKNQLLYLDSTTLAGLSEKVLKARPMISFINEHYSLKGLFSFLGLMVRFSSGQQLEGMTPLFGEMDSVLVATMEGRITQMSWQNLMGDVTDSYDAGYSFIQVKPVLDYSKLRPVKPAIEEAKRIVSSYRTGVVTVRITGKKAMTYEEMGSVMDGAIQASILALIMVSLVLWLGLRSFRLIAATLLTLIVGLIMTAAFSTWAVGQLNMISVAFAVLYIGLGVDYAIHICLRYRELGQEKLDSREAITISIKDIAPALVLSTLSTSIGFYAFVPTDFAGVSELGIIAGTGMFISLLVTLTLLPCLIWKFSALSSKKINIVNQPDGPLIEKFRIQIRIATIILALGAVWLLPKIKFDYDPINLRDPKSESVATIRELMSSQNFTPWTLNILARDSTASMRYLQDLKSLSTVDRVLNIYSFIPKNQTPKLAIIDKLQGVFSKMPKISFHFDQVPQDQQIKAIEDFGALLASPFYSKNLMVNKFSKHLLQFQDTLISLDQSGKEQLIENLQSSLLISLPHTIRGLLTSLDADTVSFESLPKNLKDRWVSTDGILRVQVLPAAGIISSQELRAFSSQVQDVAPEATGDLVVTLAAGDTVVRAFKQAILFALTSITVLLLVYLRNIRDTMFILLPLMLAGAFTGALTVVLNIDFNFANIIALPLLLGLGVDNGVHIVHRAKIDKSGRSLLQTSTARAILFSSLTTLFSFGNLAFSPHRGTASMGLLLTFGVLFVLLATLVMLPAFLPKKGETGDSE